MSRNTSKLVSITTLLGHKANIDAASEFVIFNDATLTIEDARAIAFALDDAANIAEARAEREEKCRKKHMVAQAMQLLASVQ